MHVCFSNNLQYICNIYLLYIHKHTYIYKYVYICVCGFIIFFCPCVKGNIILNETCRCSLVILHRITNNRSWLSLCSWFAQTLSTVWLLYSGDEQRHFVVLLCFLCDDNCASPSPSLSLNLFRYKWRQGRGGGGGTFGNTSRVRPSQADRGADAALRCGWARV